MSLYSLSFLITVFAFKFQYFHIQKNVKLPHLNISIFYIKNFILMFRNNSPLNNEYLYLLALFLGFYEKHYTLVSGKFGNTITKVLVTWNI